MASMQVEVTSQERLLFSGEASMVVAPGAGGELGIMPQHAPLLTQIKPGELKIVPPDGGEPEALYVSGGILEVQPNKVTVLADVAERGEDLDEARAEAARAAAQEKLANAAAGDMDYAAAQAELAQAAAQLRMLQKLRKKAQ